MCDAYQQLHRPGLVIAPDRRGCGTNGLLFDPHRAPTLAYGTNSFLNHRQQAHQQGLSCAVVRGFGLGRDIDLPADLRFLASCRASHGAANTIAYLHDSGIAARLGVAADCANII